MTTTCPSCGETFNNLDANPGFFGTSTLETGRQPALEGETTETRQALGNRDRETGEGSRTPLDWRSDDQAGDK